MSRKGGVDAEDADHYLQQDMGAFQQMNWFIQQQGMGTFLHINRFIQQREKSVEGHNWQFDLVMYSMMMMAIMMIKITMVPDTVIILTRDR